MTVQPIPSWLDRAFLEAALGETVLDFSATPAAPVGSGYGGCLTRTKVQLKNGSRSVIVKSELTVGGVKENFDIQSCEPHFYYKFLPAAEKLGAATFAPRSLPSPRPETVVLEDLKELGFEMADRCRQLDFDHCALYASAAAELHAASLAVMKKDSALVEAMGDEKMYADGLKGAAACKRMMAQGTACFLEATEGVPEFKRAHEVVRDVKDRLWDMLVDAHGRVEGAVNTINQGDPWTTNMMFRYEHGKVVDVRLLDFQVLRVGSPVNDLIMLIYGSANHDVKESRVSELYDLYLQHFNGRLRHFGLDEVLTRDELLSVAQKLSPLIILANTTYLPLTLDPRPIEFDVFMKDDKYLKKYYHEEFCNLHLPRLIEQMENSGVLEYMENLSKQFRR